jgi:hypothetical protein
MRYACAWLLVLAAACGDDDDGDDSGPGRGSAACQDWQDAICDFASGECRALDRATCDDNFKSVTCNSDARATECSNAFNSGSCMAPPPNCDLSDLADPAPARQACEQLLSRLCTHVVDCGMATEAACLQEARTAVDCSRAIGHSLGFEACIAEIDTLACTVVALPDACDDVIKIQM